ncbi:MAG: alanine--glyoxylate aminotransferase family protein [Methanosarcinaceae archaeon]|nr:alanine--glyoxylate aminotransferase family protein [Methanosarcinaceae archaeon]
MKQLLIMTPGPTQVRENVRAARAKVTTNPDVDIEYFDEYKRISKKGASIVNTENDFLILSGEGMLGLDAACASIVEPGDRVLIVSNGIFGEGFSDMVKVYGGNPVIFKSDTKRGVNVSELENFVKEEIEKNGPFKCATVVHCDTPSGVLNDIEKICPCLKSCGILTIVDAVSSIAGHEIFTDDWKIDILIGGSQKAISAPPGLTTITISEDAYSAMENRKTPIPSYYCNLLIWKNYYEKKWFPYTPPISDICGLDVAFQNIIDEGNDIYLRHERIAKALRNTILKSSLKLYLDSDFSNTTTSILVPETVSSDELLDIMKQKYGILIAGCFGYLKGKVIRIGHMGENANKIDVARTLNALSKSLKSLGFETKTDLEAEFLKEIEKDNCN